MRAVKGARNRLVALEDLTDEELDQLQHQFERLANAEERKWQKKDRESGT